MVIKIVFFLILISLISLAMSYILDKCITYRFHVLSFYFAGFAFVLSAVKYYLGYHKENLIESFWNVQIVTLVHYGIPLAVIAVAMPLLLKLLFKEKTVEVIRYFDSALFFTLSFTFFFVREINNKTYSVAFLIAVVVTAAAILFKLYWGGGIYRQERY